MSEEQRQALQAERADLDRKLRKRRDMPGFTANAREIEARMAEIDAELEA